MSTIREVAALAGVSIATVSRVINNDTKDLEMSFSIYKKALDKFDDKILIKLNILENDDNSLKFNRYIESVEDANLLPGQIMERFGKDTDRQVIYETVEYVKSYIQKLIQEPIILDKPVSIRQGDYKLTASEVRERLERITDTL